MTSYPTVPFSDVVNDVTSSFPRLPKGSYLSEGKYPVIDQGSEEIAGYSNDESMLSSLTEPVLLFGDHTRRFKLPNRPFIVGADGVKVLRTTSVLDPAYALHWFRHLDLPSNGYSRHFKFLKETRVPLPPLPEQRRIASILDRASDLAISSRRSSALTGTLKQALFREWFGVDTHRSFEIAALGDLIDPNRPISYGILMPGPETPGGVPYIRVTDFSGGVVDVERVRKTTAAIDEEFRRSRLRAGDLLFSIRGHVGRTAVVPLELDGANITQDTARLALRGADPEFVREWLATPFAQLWMRQRTKGAAVKGLNLGDLRLLPVPMPAIDRQTQFGDRIRAIDTGLVRLSKLTRIADELVASIQSRAFRGEL